MRFTSLVPRLWIAKLEFSLKESFFIPFNACDDGVSFFLFQSQKRNLRTNIRLVIFPFFLCLLLVLIQSLVNKELDKPSNRCGCTCVDTNGDGQCEKKCGIEYSTLDQVGTCPIPHPPEWPPLLQIPAQRYRAVRTDFISYSDLSDESCKTTGSCPVTMLMTGNNQTLGLSMAFLHSKYFDLLGQLNTCLQQVKDQVNSCTTTF